MNRTRRMVSVFGVRPARIGGTEVFARRLSERLAEREWESVLCFDAEPTGDVRRYLSLPNVSFEVLEDSWKFHWRPAMALGRILSRTRPEILHLYFTGFLSPYPWVARWKGVKQVFFTDQGSHAENYVAHRRPWWKRTAARALNTPLDGVVCISDYNAACMKSRGLIDARRVRRIYNSVDVSARHGDGAEFRRRHGIPLDALVVMQVSWIIPEKGVEDLIQAATIVLKKAPAAHFVIAGEGKERGAYMEVVKRAGLEDRFTWTGLVHDPTREGLYAAADVVCLVSRWEEAFGWVIAEAIAAGKPLIGTRVGAIPELVRDGETGYLVPKRNPEAIAARVLELLGDAGLRERFGRAGRALAEREFDLERNLDELMRVYGFEV
jgi:glycosyltransferase involved in cell wall biosynthesis